MRRNVVTARELSVSYGEFCAIEGIDFECYDGEFVAIVGRSGTGKSSFLNALAGLIPYSGSVGITGSLGYVFQNHALFPWMTVERNIAFGIKDQPARDRKARTNEMLERIEMLEFAKRYPT